IREDRRQCVLRGTGDIGAVRTRIQNRRRPENATAERELIIHRVGGFAVKFPEAQVRLDDVTVDWEAARERIGVGGTISYTGKAVEAGPSGIPVLPVAKTKRELAEGRPDAAVEVDLRGGAVRERDALARQAQIALETIIEIVSRLEVGGDRRLVVRLRDT